MAKKVFNMEGGLHSANAFTAFEARAYGSCVADPLSFKVLPASGMTVRVSLGDAIIDGQTPRRVQLDAPENIALSPASTSYARKDLIVAYIDSSVSPTTAVVDNTNNILKIVAVNGTPSANPATPSTGEIQAKIGAGNQYMILAEILVAKSVSSIQSSAITDKRKVITTVPAESISGKINGSQIANSTITADNINFATLSNATANGGRFSEQSWSQNNWQKKSGSDLSFTTTKPNQKVVFMCGLQFYQGGYSKARVNVDGQNTYHVQFRSELAQTTTASQTIMIAHTVPNTGNHNAHFEFAAGQNGLRIIDGEGCANFAVFPALG